MRLAYADPPYPGMAHFYPERTEVDHAQLIARLAGYDGWALSTASTTLIAVGALCPAGTRIGAWVKSFASWKPGNNPAYAWEPVLFKQARILRPPTERDWIIEPITLRRGLTGAKPRRVCLWILHLLGAQPGDTVDDLYPGTGAMGRAWREFCGTLITRDDAQRSLSI